MVYALVYCNRGFEDVCLSEIKEVVKTKGVIYPELVLCEVSDIKEVCKLAYTLQTANRVCLFIGKTSELETPDDFKAIISNKSLAIRVMNGPDATNDTLPVAKKICKLFDSFEIPYSIDLKTPQILIASFKADDDFLCGIDFSGDLNKRDYLIFTHNQALRPTIAASLIRLSGFSNKGVLLDPFCGGGTIVIEAAIKNIKGIHFHDFDKLPCSKLISDISYETIDEKKDKEYRIVGYDINLNTITSARKNAKIASIQKDIELSVIDVHYLDMKFDTKTVEYIVTHPPLYSKSSDIKKIIKIWDDLLFIGHDILTKRMVVIVNTKEEFKELILKYKFKIKEEREVYQGELLLFVFVLEK